MPGIKTAFVLGAGLGTRLRPLTDEWPKPLLPVRGRPMVTHAFDNVIAAGARRILVNTHHCPGRWAEVFPSREYCGVPLTFVHEPVLLDTGGGLKNIESWCAGETLLVHNGDVLTDLSLGPLFEAHARGESEVTLAGRSAGGPLHLGLGADGRLADIRGRLGSEVQRAAVFTGVYLVEPAFFGRFQPGVVESVIPKFLDLVREGRAPRVAVIDAGGWHDLGTIEEYRAHGGTA